MNAHSKFERTAALFRSNRNQAVRIPKDMEFPEEVKKVVIRKVGKSLHLCPEESLWLDYFAESGVSDFPDRSPQGDYEERGSF